MKTFVEISHLLMCSLSFYFSFFIIFFSFFLSFFLIFTDLVNVVKRDAKENLEKSVEGFKCK